MSDLPDESPISAAAQAALDEYLARERLRILRIADANRTSPVLGADDVVRAYEQGSSSGSAARTFYQSAGGYRARAISRYVYLALATIAGLMAVLAIVTAVLLSKDDTSSTALNITTFASLGIAVAALAGLSTGYFAIRQVRRREYETKVRQELIEASFRGDASSIYASEDLGDLERSSNLGVSVARRDDNGWSSGGFPDIEFRLLRAWDEVEDQLRRVAIARYGTELGREPIGVIISVLVNEGTISAGAADEIKEALGVRNRLVHQSGVSRAELHKAASALGEIEAELVRLSRHFDLRDS